MRDGPGEMFDNSQSLLASATASSETEGTSRESTTTPIVANTPSEDKSDCFCAGTRIATPEGYVPVERLAAGDTVMTATGAAQRIVWIGSGRPVIRSPYHEGAFTVYRRRPDSRRAPDQPPYDRLG
jgi:hypothetical protein